VWIRPADATVQSWIGVGVTTNPQQTMFTAQSDNGTAYRVMVVAHGATGPGGDEVIADCTYTPGPMPITDCGDGGAAGDAGVGPGAADAGTPNGGGTPDAGPGPLAPYAGPAGADAATTPSGSDADAGAAQHGGGGCNAGSGTTDGAGSLLFLLALLPLIRRRAHRPARR